MSLFTPHSQDDDPDAARSPRESQPPWWAQWYQGSLIISLTGRKKLLWIWYFHSLMRLQDARMTCGNYLRLHLMIKIHPRQQHTKVGGNFAGLLTRYTSVKSCPATLQGVHDNFWTQLLLRHLFSASDLWKKCNGQPQTFGCFSTVTTIFYAWPLLDLQLVTYCCTTNTCDQTSFQIANFHFSKTTSSTTIPLCNCIYRVNSNWVARRQLFYIWSARSALH